MFRPNNFHQERPTPHFSQGSSNWNRGEGGGRVPFSATLIHIYEDPEHENTM